MGKKLQKIIAITGPEKAFSIEQISECSPSYV
jgi:hypothetical protein